MSTVSREGAIASGVLFWEGVKERLSYLVDDRRSQPRYFVGVLLQLRLSSLA